MTTFSDFGLAEPLTRALAEENYVAPTPVQTAAIPVVLAGRDLVGIAQTGTGKTAAFALPILHRLGATPRRREPKSCRVLVLSPTRELSSQIVESFQTYGRHGRVSVALAIGGVPINRQIRALQAGVDVLVATPGRLVDLSKSGALRFDRIDTLVLDEADRMLDMGFIHDIRWITARLPRERQSLFFSATMPPAIAELARQLLRDPAKVEVTPVSSTAARVTQQIIHVDRAGKPALLAELLRDRGVTRALVFSRTKHGADKIVRGLEKLGLAADAIHGNKSQNKRERALAAFRDGSAPILVATDIAARGIDVADISHVINFDLPNEPETYVHRIGRTARAGAAGVAISLCAPDERPLLRAIQKLTGQSIPASRGDDAEPGRPNAAIADDGRHDEARPARGASESREARRGSKPRGPKEYRAKEHGPTKRGSNTSGRHANDRSHRAASKRSPGAGGPSRAHEQPRAIAAVAFLNPQR